MVTAHRNEGIEPLYQQLKTMYPGIVIGWIGDTSHQARPSAHNPNSAGRVNAIDVMIGPKFTYSQCYLLTTRLSAHADKRINNIIFDRMIWDDKVGTWKPYYGRDPHTGHAHIEVHDSAHTNNKSWIITNPIGRKYTMLPLHDLALPELVYGDNDKPSGYDYVTRVQRQLRIKDDGYYGKMTAAAIRDLMAGGNGKTIGINEWKRLYGIVNL
jgi:hypothetical protein